MTSRGACGSGLRRELSPGWQRLGCEAATIPPEANDVWLDHQTAASRHRNGVCEHPKKRRQPFRAREELDRERERRAADEAEVRTRIGIRWPGR